MILKNLVKSQELILKIKRHKTKEVFDIVIYGSVIKGKKKFNDIDIAVILNQKKDLNYKLELAQKLRHDLELKEKEIDVKVIDLSDLKDNSFLARQSILAEGFSLIYQKFLHEIFGFKTYVLFNYKQDKTTASQKKMLYYALKGRRGTEGIVNRTKSLQLSNCTIEVPLEYSEEFKELLELHKLEYTSKISIHYLF